MLLILRTVLLLTLTVALSGCATRTVAPYVRPPPEHATPAQADGAFAAIEAGIHATKAPGLSGFRLIDSNEDGLLWRLMLIDSARHSIDMQYYLWYGDTAGRIVAKRILDAADRGVRVRLLIDDLNTLIKDAATVSERDEVAAWLDAHPNVELRLFNPWSSREIAGRVGGSLKDMGRVNQRMHNKALIVDNQAAILGGRNIGDEYMGLNAEFNFHDLDVLGIGPVARQASEIFDLYWNSDWVMPASALEITFSQAELDAAREELLQLLNAAESLSNFPIPPQTWSAELAALPDTLHIGTGRVYSDLPTDGAIDHVMLERIRSMIEMTQSELLIVNAYIIPTDQGIATLQGLKSRGAEIKILTNSLASHDVSAVNSHYRQWRIPIIRAGVELYEMRHDAEFRQTVCDTPPTRAEFAGLHSKALVVDRKHVFIGSMNFDPRSAQLNTEMGVFIESRELGEALARLIERDVQPANSWRVELHDDKDLRWVNDEETVTSQPARSWWQRVEDKIFRAIPKKYF